MFFLCRNIFILGFAIYMVRILARHCCSWVYISSCCAVQKDWLIGLDLVTTFLQGLSVPDYFSTFTTKNGHGPINTGSQSFNSKLTLRWGSNFASSLLLPAFEGDYNMPSSKHAKQVCHGHDFFDSNDRQQSNRRCKMTFLFSCRYLQLDLFYWSGSCTDYHHGPGQYR